MGDPQRLQRGLPVARALRRGALEEPPSGAPEDDVHAERLLAIARRWLGEPQTTGAADLGQEAVEALCLLLPVRDRLLGEFALKSRIEATFAESGWTPLRCRELLRSLERLPDKPRTDGEKIVADADSILGLGTLGLPASLAESLTREAGFTRFRPLDFGHPINAFYEVRP